MENTDIEVSYSYWCDGSCNHTDPRNNWMGMGVYSREENTIYPVPIIRKLAISGPKGDHNISEYLAILCALTDIYILEKSARTAVASPVEERQVVVHSDSQLVIRQITGEYNVNKQNMKILYTEVHRMVLLLNNMGIDVNFKWNRRDTPNQQIADHLSKVGNKYFIDIQPDDTINHSITELEDALLPGTYRSIKRGLHWRSG